MEHTHSYIFHSGGDEGFVLGQRHGVPRKIVDFLGNCARYALDFIEEYKKVQL
jgi:hypothetical protein